VSEISHRPLRRARPDHGAAAGRERLPWDREQTHASIKPYLLEETYEVLESIDDNDPAKLQEELGDLALQVVFHAQMADEAGLFAIADVLRGINEKLRRRHPHIFGDVKADTAQEVLFNWSRSRAGAREGARPRLVAGRGPARTSGPPPRPSAAGEGLASRLRLERGPPSLTEGRGGLAELRARHGERAARPDGG